MNDLVKDMVKSLRDPEYADAYADSMLNIYLATQIKVLREQRGLTQGDLGKLIGTTQGGVSRIEDADYSAWSVATLRKVARALSLRLRISLEAFGTIPDQVVGMSELSLRRPTHKDDPVLFPENLPMAAAGKVKNIGDYSSGPNENTQDMGSMRTASGKQLTDENSNELGAVYG